MPVQIQFRRDTAANWTSNNPTLASGELGLETDTGQIKVGDGTTAWASLAYGGITGPTGATGPGIANVTATASEINILDGATLTTTELNYVDGVTSAIQTQLDGKVDEVNGAVTTASTSLNVVRNITLSTEEPTGGADGDVWLKYTA